MISHIISSITTVNVEFQVDENSKPVVKSITFNGLPTEAQLKEAIAGCAVQFANEGKEPLKEEEVAGLMDAARAEIAELDVSEVSAKK